ncbi:MAG: hypothetical protein LBO65_03885 [Spirochaetaceae bacterium]|jgi:adhesin HecA-like repeat protein|nr:hypothetical protein [Spirochaetaceae bacterium]
MKRKILYGLIALLSISVLFFGCSTGTSNDSSTVIPLPSDPDPITPTTPADAARDFSIALSALLDDTIKDDTTVVYNGSTVTLDTTGGTVIIDSSFIIPSGVTLVLPDDDLTVTTGSLTNNGTLSLADTKSINVATSLINNGGISVAGGEALTLASGDLVNGGTLSLEGDFTVTAGNVTNSGTITADGDLIVTVGTITNSGTLSLNSVTPSYNALSNSGRIEISSSTTLAVTGNFANEANGTLDVKGGITGDVTNAGTIVGAAGKNITGAVTNSGTISVPTGIFTVTSSFTNNGDGSITGAAGTLAVTGAIVNNANKTLTVANGVTVTTADNFTNEGTIVVRGTLTNPTALKDNNNTGGTITVDGGTLTFAVALGATEVGEITVRNSGVLTDGTTSGFNVGPAGTTFKLDNANAVFGYTDALYGVDGNVTLAADAFSIDAARPLYIASTGKLTIAANKVLTLLDASTTTGTPSLLGIGEGAAIAISAGSPAAGKIVFTTGADEAIINFYETDNDAFTGDITTAKTFVWDGNADGSGNDGWLEQQP